MTHEDYEASVKLLKVWSKAYYKNDKPLATDEEYDKLYRAVKQYGLDNPEDKIENVGENIGGSTLSLFKKNKHIDKLWSLEDAFTLEEVHVWYERMLDNGISRFSTELKFDGLTLNILYNKGNIVSASTRGNGVIGEDVTNNALTIYSIPKSITYSGKVEIRGEVIMPKKMFDSINDKAIENNQKPFSNPRNAAAGSLRQSNPTITEERGLVFYPWDIGYTEEKFNTIEDKMKFIYSLGFLESPYKANCKEFRDIIDFYGLTLDKRNDLSMMLDGIVIKVSDVNKQQEIGYTAKVPKWAIAYKYPAVEKVTKIVDVEYDISRFGTITPVAIIEPTILDGATVTRVTLHNFNYIKNRDYRIGDYVTVIRSGDVIPKLIDVFKDRRKDTVLITPPEKCMYCGSNVLTEDTKDATGVYYCSNNECIGVKYMKLEFFASSKAMEIYGLGYSIAKELIDSKLVRNIHMIYSLSINDLKLLNGFSGKKATNLVKAIRHSKGTPLYKLIVALGIRNIGTTVSIKIANRFKLNFHNVTMSELMAIDGIGEEMASSYIDYMINNEHEVSELVKNINPTIPTERDVIDNKYKDKVFVITGSFDKGKKFVMELIEDVGGIIKSSVTNKTDYVVVGDKAGLKLNKANELGISLIRDIYDIKV